MVHWSQLTAIMIQKQSMTVVCRQGLWSFWQVKVLTSINGYIMACQVALLSGVTGVLS